MKTTSIHHHTMQVQIKESFIANYGSSPELILMAPGRINIIGEHTDYNNGFVLPAAIDKGIYFAFQQNKKQDSINIRSLDYKNTCNLSINGFSGRGRIPSWAEYLKAIISIFKEKRIALSGYDVLFGGNIPIGAGMSSSAALCCGFIAGLVKMEGLDVSLKEMAMLAQKAEHRIGLNCGIMDQYAVLFGKKDQVICLDCQSLEAEYFPIALEDYDLVLINSKIEHELAVGNEYNKRRYSCERVVKCLAEKNPQIKSLRDVAPSLLLQYQQELEKVDFKRANFVLNENRRVMETVKALKENNFEEVGKLLSQSHQGLSLEYEVSIPEVDFLVSTAIQDPAVLGSRMMGGGFGGCTINLIHRDKKEEALERILKTYFDKTGIATTYYDVKIEDGVYSFD